MEIVLKYLGYLLLIFSFFPIIPIVGALYYGEAVLPFIVLVFVSLFLSFLLLKLCCHPSRNIMLTDFDLPRSISLSALSFIIISFIGTIPYLMIHPLRFVDALFESVSGFTTTGLTVLSGFDLIPRSLLLWRAETQWIGGLSIILLFLLIISAMRRQESLKESTTKARVIGYLYQAQGASEKIEANTRKSMHKTVLIYLAYTTLGILFLSLVGFSVFEAVSISFTTISTGGFSVTEQFYTAWPVLFIVSFLMIAGSVSFVIHNQLFRMKIRELWRNGTLKVYFSLILLAFLLVFSFVGDVKIAFFETVSAFTTTGYSIANIALLPAIVIFIIVCGMMIGGMIGSTCGGIKINRIKLMVQSIWWMVKKAASPSGAIIPLKSDGRPIADENMLVIHAYIACYVLILVLGTGIVMITGESFLDSSFQVVSALGNIGLSTATLAAFTGIAKSVLILAMLFGRLEIFPLLVLGKFIHEKLRLKLRSRQERAKKLFYMIESPSELWKRKL